MWRGRGCRATTTHELFATFHNFYVSDPVLLMYTGVVLKHVIFKVKLLFPLWTYFRFQEARHPAHFLPLSCCGSCSRKSRPTCPHLPHRCPQTSSSVPTSCMFTRTHSPLTTRRGLFTHTPSPLTKPTPLASQLDSQVYALRCLYLTSTTHQNSRRQRRLSRTMSRTSRCRQQRGICHSERTSAHDIRSCFRTTRQTDRDI